MNVAEGKAEEEAELEDEGEILETAQEAEDDSYGQETDTLDVLQTEME